DPAGTIPEVFASRNTGSQLLPRQIGGLVRDYLAGRLLIFQGVDRIANLLFGSAHGRFSKRIYRDGDLETLSSDIVRQYVSSYRYLANLSSSFHFQFFCFLQPVIFTRAEPTAEEWASDDHAQDDSLKSLFRM